MTPQYAEDLSRIAAMTQIRPNVHYAAALNVERARSFMETHLGCTAREVARELGVSDDRARRLVRRIRAEWVGRPGGKK
ncbi:hypothetical protein [Bradyrhizobium liaoningense]